jgi:hypothetical protein
VVEHALLDSLAAPLRVDRRRVEAEHHDLDALQPHDAVGLGPAPVVADAHADDAAEHAPDREAEVARLEIALLEMLMGALRVELVMPGQMHLAVLADDGAVAIDQDRGVEVAPVRGQLGIAEGHRHPVPGGALEERARGGVRHLALEPEIGLRPVLVMPARKEGGQRKLGINDEVRPFLLRLVHEVDHAADHDLAAVVPLDRPELGGGDADVAHVLSF